MKKLLSSLLIAGASHAFADCRPSTWPVDDEFYRQISKDNFAAVKPEERPSRNEVCYQATDLNGDMRADFVVTLENRGFCGSRGCTQYIYRTLPDGRFEKIGEELGYVDVNKSLSGWIHNGYIVLVSAGGSAVEPSFSALMFDGKQYR